MVLFSPPQICNQTGDRAGNRIDMAGCGYLCRLSMERNHAKYSYQVFHSHLNSSKGNHHNRFTLTAVAFCWQPKRQRATLYA